MIYNDKAKNTHMMLIFLSIKSVKQNRRNVVKSVEEIVSPTDIISR